MSAEEPRPRERLCPLSRSFRGRGLTPGSSGNALVRPENSSSREPASACLGRLHLPSKLSSGDKPIRESFLRLALHHERPSAGSVVHLHATHAVALWVRADLDPEQQSIPPVTACYVMCVGKLKQLPCYAGDDPALTDAVLLASHGPVVAGNDLEAAAHTTEELDKTARLRLLPRGEGGRRLTPDQVTDLRRRVPP